MSRFLSDNETVIDKQTGLMWTKNAAMFEFPMTWSEAFAAIQDQNVRILYGHNNWRLPNRNELFSLVSHKAVNPALPPSHPFTNVFNGYYWTSSTCVRLTSQAWYIHLGGARVFKGMKHGSYMVWPVRTAENRQISEVFQTGQQGCFNENGDVIGCRGTGQDGEFRSGRPHPGNRFSEQEQVVHDHSTGLTWLQNANVFGKTINWKAALGVVSEMNATKAFGFNDWRVPNIVELEQLTDLGRHSPALPAGHRFDEVQAYYWSSTTSRYDTDYAWVLYMIDGVVGVGHKPLSEFYLWPVRGEERFIA